MNAIHLTCERVAGGGLANLTFDKQTKTYRSGMWALSNADADRLVGGWVYLHEAKAISSQFGGRIISFESGSESGQAEQIFLIVEAALEGRGQKWRGQDKPAAWSSGVVVGSLPHERV